jgi:hypothetical protein
MRQNDMSARAESAEQLMREALGQLRSAIELLDRASAPGQIAANVDLAAAQLEQTLSMDGHRPTDRFGFDQQPFSAN